MEVGVDTSCILPTGLLPGRETCVGRVHDARRWSEAEDSVAKLISGIQPNEECGKLRKAIADYIHGLIGKCFSCQVFIFGSVPLKTNLPDGDIDLTVFSNNENLKDTWSDKIYQVLKEEEKNENAEFCLKEVHRIDAGVKVIKCLVESIVVDISFNQIGGLGTLCFLEEMDHLIDRDHLFKRSVILIKAWCYYESRILGAHHGLISTYALETLILYIFHVFNNSFAGPLEVLYRFLEFFSNFDWDNFCVSIWGPVPIQLLPEMAVMPPRKNNGGLFHKKFFLKSCSMFYDILTDGQHNESHSFVSKNFNIVDPLCMHNNLGRSVCKGSFLRIRSAFALGAKKLIGLLDFPKEKMNSELTQFFMNTWERYRTGLHTKFSTSNLEQLQSAKSIQVGASYTSRNILNLKVQNDDISVYPGGEHLADIGLSFYGASSQILRIINQHSKDISCHNGICHSKKQEDMSSKVISKNQDHLERNLESAEPVRTDYFHENLNFNYSNNIEKGNHWLQDESCVFCSAKTCFLSGLINASEISFGESHIIQNFDNHEALPYGSEHDYRIKNLSFGVMGNETVNSIDDSSCLRNISSLHSIVSNDASHIYHDSGALPTVATALYRESENCRTQHQIDNSEVPQHITAQKSNSGYTVDTGLVLSSNSQQRAIVNSGVFPSALYSTGPPVPFLEMLQTYNFPSQANCYGGYGEFDNEALICHGAAFYGNANPVGMFDQHESYSTDSAMGSRLINTSAMPKLPHELPSQNISFVGPSAYRYPIAVPMVIQYFQGISPPSGPAQSVLFHESQFVATTDIWAKTRMRTSEFFTFGDGVGNYHGCIRAYLPSPRVVFRDQSSTTSFKWNQNHERDGLDKGWQNRISRRPGVFWLTEVERSHSMNPYTPTCSFSPNCSQTVGLDLYKCKEIKSHISKNGPISSSSSSSVSPCKAQEKKQSQSLTPGSSSSRLQRWMAEENYQLKDEDFPPL